MTEIQTSKEEDFIEENKILLKFYNDKEPHDYITMTDTMLQDPKVSKIKEIYNQTNSTDYFNTIGAIIGCMKEKILKIDNDLMVMLEDTDRSTPATNLPWNFFFVDTKLKYNDFIVMGFGIGRNIMDNQISICFVAFDELNMEEFFSTCPLFDYTKYGKFPRFAKVTDFVHVFANNIINMINNSSSDEIYYNEIISDPIQNAKRIKRGQTIKPTMSYLHLNGRLREYARYYSLNRASGTKLRYLVRGHFMEFRDDRYVHKKGTRTWIEPYFKGDPTLKDSSVKIVTLKK